MVLKPDFSFSQGSLSDFQECRRRFQYRYLQGVTWPALEVEPALENEQRLQRGARFHQLIRQHLLGVPTDRLTAAAAGDDEMAVWWGNYLAGAPATLEGTHYPEIGLVGRAGAHRLVARYDLVVVEAGGPVTIFDWKTNRKRPRKSDVSRRLQTRVYPYLLVQAGAHLNQGEKILPEQVTMVYWYAAHPAKPHRFPYSQTQYEKDGKYLAGLVDEIDGMEEDEFPLTEDLERCKFCVYRSLCDRGIQAGTLIPTETGDGFEAEAEFEIDFDQIAEIEF
jgi:CRISPR/Cas system-associated exonuclease Cas4 (RecB family)